MKRAIRLAFGAVLSAIALFNFAPTAAKAAVTCNSYHSLYPTEGSEYPNDWSTSNPNGHYYVCANLTHSAAQQILSAVQGLPHNGNITNPTTVRDLLNKAGVTYFYFAKRTDANTYMQATAPYSAYSQFQSTTARCGNTGYGFVISPRQITIASEIYDQCQLAGSTISNPNLEGVTLHESGHAFDYSIAGFSTNMAVPPSFSKAWVTLFNGSGNSSTIASDMYYVNHGDQNTGNVPPTTCGMYDSLVQSAVELDLGLPTDNSTPVCTANTVNSPYVGKTNSQIAQMESPYFTAPAGNPATYSDLWGDVRNPDRQNWLPCSASI